MSDRLVSGDDLAAYVGSDGTRTGLVAADPVIRPGSVKICGLREVEHACAAVTAGADLIGFIFAPARRRVMPEQARRAIAAAKAGAGSRAVLAVGVFVDASPEEMNATAEEAGLDLLQLHGSEPPDLLGELARPVIKALRPTPEATAEHVEGELERFAAVGNAPVSFLIEGFAPDAAGGAGARADWRLAADLARGWPVILAGGLDPSNVGEAVGCVKPAVVDVSSGVETAGVKDAAKIGAFVIAAKRAFVAAARGPREARG